MGRTAVPFYLAFRACIVLCVALARAATPLSPPAPAAPRVPCASTDIFVQPTEAPSGPHAFGAPCFPGDDACHATVHSAQAAVRRVRAQCPDAGVVTVHLLPGVHRLPHPLLLDPRDSGQRGAPVVWRGGSDGRTVLSGGVPLAGWGPVAGHPELLQVRVPSAAVVRQLWVAGVGAERVAVAPASEGLAEESGAYATSEGIVTPSKAPLGWPSPAAVEMRWDLSYQQHRCGVVHVATRQISGRNMTVVAFQQPCWRLGTVCAMAPVGVPVPTFRCRPTSAGPMRIRMLISMSPPPLPP